MVGALCLHQYGGARWNGVAANDEVRTVFVQDIEAFVDVGIAGVRVADEVETLTNGVVIVA